MRDPASMKESAKKELNEQYEYAREDNGVPEKMPKGPRLGMRHVQALLIFLNIVVVYVSRLNIAVAVVAMTNANTTNPNFQEFDWNEKQKSYIISSFYWGYVLTQFPGGYLSRRFGTKIVMFVSTFSSAIFSLVTPVSIPWGGWQVFCAIRAVQGVFQGVMFPAMHAHLAKWSPLKERNRLGALAYTGIEFGIVLALAVSGIIAESPLGWPGISYISAALCFGWSALWLVFAANNAPESRFITVAERDYIELSLQRSEDFHAKRIPIPWRAIWTSVPFNALLIMSCAQGWGFSTVQAELPSYMNGVLNFEIKSNALFSALPYLSMWLISYVFLIAADIIMKRRLMCLSVMRKTFNSIALWVPALGLIAVSFLNKEHRALAITLMTVTLGVSGGTTIGSMLNIIDLSPNHTGILMGIANGISNLLPFITPLVVGLIVTDVHDRSQWQIVFTSSGITLFLGNLVYIIWGTTKTQAWDAEDYLQAKDVEKETDTASSKAAEPLTLHVEEVRRLETER